MRATVKLCETMATIILTQGVLVAFGRVHSLIQSNKALDAIGPTRCKLVQSEVWSSYYEFTHKMLMPVNSMHRKFFFLISLFCRVVGNLAKGLMHLGPCSQPS